MLTNSAEKAREWPTLASGRDAPLTLLAVGGRSGGHWPGGQPCGVVLLLQPDNRSPGRGCSGSSQKDPQLNRITETVGCLCNRFSVRLKTVS